MYIFENFSILGSSSKGIHDLAEPRHVYLPPTCLIYWSVQRQGHNILSIYKTTRSVDLPLVPTKSGHNSKLVFLTIPKYNNMRGLGPKNTGRWSWYALSMSCLKYLSFTKKNIFFWVNIHHNTTQFQTITFHLVWIDKTVSGYLCTMIMCFGHDCK